MTRNQNSDKTDSANPTTQWGIFFFIIGLVCLGAYFWCKSEVRLDDLNRAHMLQDTAHVLSIVAFSLLFGSLPMIFGKAETMRVLLILVILGGLALIAPIVIGFVLIGIVLMFLGGGGEIIAVIFLIKK